MPSGFVIPNEVVKKRAAILTNSEALRFLESVKSDKLAIKSSQSVIVPVDPLILQAQEEAELAELNCLLEAQRQAQEFVEAQVQLDAIHRANDPDLIHEFEVQNRRRKTAFHSLINNFRKAKLIAKPNNDDDALAAKQNFARIEDERDDEVADPEDDTPGPSNIAVQKPNPQIDVIDLDSSDDDQPVPPKRKRVIIEESDSEDDDDCQIIEPKASEWPAFPEFEGPSAFEETKGAVIALASNEKVFSEAFEASKESLIKPVYEFESVDGQVSVIKLDAKISESLKNSAGRTNILFENKAIDLCMQPYANVSRPLPEEQPSVSPFPNTSTPVYVNHTVTFEEINSVLEGWTEIMSADSECKIRDSKSELEADKHRPRVQHPAISLPTPVVGSGLDETKQKRLEYLLRHYPSGKKMETIKREMPEAKKSKLTVVKMKDRMVRHSTLVRSAIKYLDNIKSSRDSEFLTLRGIEVFGKYNLSPLETVNVFNCRPKTVCQLSAVLEDFGLRFSTDELKKFAEECNSLFYPKPKVTFRLPETKPSTRKK